MMTRVITHYSVLRPDPNVWLPIVAIVRNEEGEYFIGAQETFQVHVGEIDERTALSEFRKLKEPIPLPDSQILWVMKEGDKAVVWLANREDPVHDSQRVEIERVPLVPLV